VNAPARELKRPVASRTPSRPSLLGSPPWPSSVASEAQSPVTEPATWCWPNSLSVGFRCRGGLVFFVLRSPPPGSAEVLVGPGPRA